MHLCFFEDNLLKKFHPLTLTRPLDDLRIGICTIAQKWKIALEAKSINRILRSELRDVFPNGEGKSDAPWLWINARYLPEKELLEKIKGLGRGSCLQSGKTVIAAHVDGDQSTEWMASGKPDFSSLFVLESDDHHSIKRLWDLFQINGSEIARDIELLHPQTNGKVKIAENVVLENRKNIFMEEDTTIEAGCILNAEKGPIYIGNNATIMAGSVIYGPTAICEHATVKTNTTMYEDTTVGPVCKVGGEISNTIFHSYSNKAHDGYIGNSVVGQWCNFGAGTTVSNLKTNYSTVRVTDWTSNEEEDSGRQFLGILMGDHSKTAINCVINSGTICGVNCNILSRDFPPKFIPSFSWVGSNVIQPYKLEKALDTMGIMMARRDVSISEAYKNMMKHIAKNSSHNK